jgi:hypothetical protein
MSIGLPEKPRLKRFLRIDWPLRNAERYQVFRALARAGFLTLE